MSVLDGYKEKIGAYFSYWIQIHDNLSKWTIEDFPYVTGVDEDLTKPHCWKCVSVNNCWYRNQEGKKPEHFNYDQYTYAQIPKSKRGLYHPNCHCKEMSMSSPNMHSIKVDVGEGKIDWLFENKKGLVEAWGYRTEQEKLLLIEHLKELSASAYSQ